MAKDFSDFLEYSNREEFMNARGKAVKLALSEFANDQGIIVASSFQDAILSACQDLTIEILGEYHDWVNQSD